MPNKEYFENLIEEFEEDIFDGLLPGDIIDTIVESRNDIYDKSTMWEDTIG